MVSKERRDQINNWDNANLKRTSLALPVAEYEQLTEHLKETGEKANTFIRRAIKETITNDQKTGNNNMDG